MPSSPKSATDKKMELNVAGQAHLKSGYCIATSLDGKPCGKVNAFKYVPYCKQCVEKGDPSLDVVPHPMFGKMLVSKRKLPVG